MAFWSLNAEIWAQSPEEQERIQPYRDVWAIGEVGAQQAMRHPHRLPWVPDVVGRDWQKPGAVVIFGSAYGAFVGREGRSGLVAPVEYARTPSAAVFTRLFHERVLPRRYYTRIAQLASAVVPSCRLVTILDHPAVREVFVHTYRRIKRLGRRR
jgi:hypothetical protein